MKNYYFAVQHSFGDFVQVITSSDIVFAENFSKELAGKPINISQITENEAELLINSRQYKVFFNRTN
jgi:hypothetical protein